MQIGNKVRVLPHYGPGYSSYFDHFQRKGTGIITHAEGKFWVVSWENGKGLREGVFYSDELRLAH